MFLCTTKTAAKGVCLTGDQEYCQACSSETEVCCEAEATIQGSTMRYSVCTNKGSVSKEAYTGTTQDGVFIKCRQGESFAIRDQASTIALLAIALISMML